MHDIIPNPPFGSLCLWVNAVFVYELIEIWVHCHKLDFEKILKGWRGKDANILNIKAEGRAPASLVKWSDLSWIV